MLRRISHRTTALLAASTGLLLCLGAAAPTQRQRARVDPWREYVARERWTEGRSFFLRSLVRACQKGGSFANIEQSVLGCMVCEYFPRTENRLAPESARQLRGWLIEHRSFTERLLFALGPADNPGRAFEIIYHLLGNSEENVLSYPGLAVACAVVWDAERPDPRLLLASFQYFVRHRGQMEFDLSSMPPEVAQYVVDSRRPIPERLWALDRFGHTDDIGRLYRRIWRDRYDYDALEGERKKVDRHGATLQNIYRYGGVCHEAAVFASEVGKAKGIPSVYIQGPTPTGIPHAWVGYLRMERSAPVWVRDTGRIGQAETVAGTVRHPQSGQSVPEHELDFALAALMHPAEERLQAQTWHAAALLLEQAGAAQLARSAMYQSLNTCVYDSSQWRTFAALARRGVFSPHEALAAAPVFSRKLGAYPNLAVDALDHLAASLDRADPECVVGLYDSLVADFRKRDLVEPMGRALLLKGKFLERRGLADRALQTYSGAIEDTLRSQTVAIELLDNAGRILVRANRLEAAIKLHKRVYYDLREPDRNIGAIRSTWALVTLRLAKLHALGGDAREHDRLIRKILRYQTGNDRYLGLLERRLRPQNYRDLNRTS